MGLFNKLFGKKAPQTIIKQDANLSKTDLPPKIEQPQIIEPPQKSGIIAINNKNGGFDAYNELLNHAKKQMYKFLQEPDSSREFEIMKKHFSEPINLEKAYYNEYEEKVVFVFSSSNVKQLLDNPEFSYITYDEYKEYPVDVLLVDVTYELSSIHIKNSTLVITEYIPTWLWLEERQNAEVLIKANNPDNIVISSDKFFIEASNIYNTPVNQIPFEELIQERNERRENMVYDDNNKVQLLPNGDAISHYYTGDIVNIIVLASEKRLANIALGMVLLASDKYDHSGVGAKISFNGETRSVTKIDILNGNEKSTCSWIGTIDIPLSAKEKAYAEAIYSYTANLLGVPSSPNTDDIENNVYCSYTYTLENGCALGQELHRNSKLAFQMFINAKSIKEATIGYLFYHSVFLKIIIPLDYDYTFAIKHGDDSLFIYKDQENGEVILGMDANGKPTDKVPQWVEMFDFYTPDEADNILLKTFGCCFIEFINKINLISIIGDKSIKEESSTEMRTIYEWYNILSEMVKGTGYDVLMKENISNPVVAIVPKNIGTPQRVAIYPKKTKCAGLVIEMDVYNIPAIRKLLGDDFRDKSNRPHYNDVPDQTIIEVCKIFLSLK
jgi:hypothetical protein